MILLTKLKLFMIIGIMNIYTMQTASTIAGQAAWRTARTFYNSPTFKRFFHEALGVNKNATKNEVSTAYRALVKKYHPDINKDPGATEKMKNINNAYDKAKEYFASGSKSYDSYKYKNNKVYDDLNKYYENHMWNLRKAHENNVFINKSLALLSCLGVDTLAYELDLDDDYKIFDRKYKAFKEYIYKSNNYLKFQDDTYNSHMETISADELIPADKQNKIDDEIDMAEQLRIFPPTDESTQKPATLIWDTDANPGITTAIIASILGTTAGAAVYYGYRYYKQPKKSKDENDKNNSDSKEKKI